MYSWIRDLEQQRKDESWNCSYHFPYFDGGNVPVHVDVMTKSAPK